MKKIMIIALISILAHAADATVINIRFKWGTYINQLSGCEPNWGLCGIDIGFLANPGPYVSNSTVSYNAKTQKVDITIPIANIPSSLVSNVGSGSISVSSDVILSSDLCKQLGITSYTIKAGTYKFTSDGSNAYFVF